MKKVVLDTSIIIDYLRTKQGLFPELALLEKTGSTLLYLPTVAVLELWKGNSMDMHGVESSVERILQITKDVPLSKQLAKKAGELIRKDTVSDFVDSVIAATALYLEAELATLNKKHFAKVKGLKIFKLQKTS